MCICGSELERSELSLSFLGMGLAGNHILTQVKNFAFGWLVISVG